MVEKQPEKLVTVLLADWREKFPQLEELFKFYFMGCSYIGYYTSFASLIEGFNSPTVQSTCHMECLIVLGASQVKGPIWFWGTGKWIGLVFCEK